MSNLSIGALIIILLFFAIGIPLAYRSEKKSFNNGICPKCGRKLKHIDTDSQGGRLWKCNGIGCNYGTWISYKKVDRRFMED